MNCKHLTLLCGLPSHSLHSIFSRTKFCIVIVVRFIEIFLYVWLVLFVLCLRNFCLYHEDIPLKPLLLHCSYFHLQSIWNWFLCVGWDRSQDLFFSVWIFSWPNTIKETILYSMCCSVVIINQEAVYVASGLIMDFLFFHIDWYVYPHMNITPS